MSAPACRHVVFCADRSYLTYVGIAAYSLLENNRAHRLEVLVLTDGIDAEDERRFGRLQEEFGVPVRVHRLSAPELEPLAALGGRGYLSVAAFYRLLIPSVLPAAPTALYLDADMIVDADIGPLLGTVLGDCAVGACTDPVAEEKEGKPGYFNSGMMLMNLARWRELDIARRTIRFAAGDTLRYLDQDALNAVLKASQVHRLDLAYNTLVFDRLMPKLQPALERASAQADEPRILHFTGEIKPWQAWFGGRHQDRYADYAGRSPWSDSGWLKEATTVKQTVWLAEAAARRGDHKAAVRIYRRLVKRLQQERRKAKARQATRIAR